MVPGHEDRPHPARAVLERRGRRHGRDAEGKPARPGRTGIVLDMRGNPGGYVNEAVGVASQFLSKGLVYIERNAAGERDGAPGLAGRRRDRPARWSSSSTGTPPAPRRSCRARCRTPAAPRSSARRRSAPARSSASSTSPTGRHCGSAPSNGSRPSGRRIWHEGIAPDVPDELPERRPAAQPRGRRTLDRRGRGRHDRRHATGQGAPGGVGEQVASTH